MFKATTGNNWSKTLLIVLTLLTANTLLQSIAWATDADEMNFAKIQSASKSKSYLNQVKIETLWYLSYGFGEKSDISYNDTRIGRGYLTLKFKPIKWFTPRITLDTHQDDHGDWKMRLKYLYGKFILPIETSLITEPNLEFGLVHGPWFDFEEHINNYRMEGTMFFERNGMLNSADAGITVGGLLGKKLGNEYREQVSAKYPGEYGSFALGLYNGGGYHAEEQNQNKVFMSRLSLRPLGLVLPNLQVSHFFIYGKGNTGSQVCDQEDVCHSGEPNWLANLFMASFEHKYFVVTAQYAFGEGNQKGEKIDPEGNSLDYQGFSVFGELKLPWIKSSLIGRYDWFDWDTEGSEPATSRIIAGYAYHFLKSNFVLLSLDRVTYDELGRAIDWQVKLTLQVHYPL